MNIQNIKALAKSLMVENNMRFPSGDSAQEVGHYIQAGNNKRITLTFIDDEFVQREQRLNNGVWMDAIEIRIKGTQKRIEMMFENAISEIIKLDKNFKLFKSLK